jgi:protein-tyrosine-phosphatase
MSDIKSVLFVCTGNSCRSVMAEGLMKKELARLGKSAVTVRSAGVRAVEGFSPTEETVSVMKAQGVDVSDFRSKTVTEDMVEDADVILVMEVMHKDDILRRFPAAASKVFLLKGYKNDAARGGDGRDLGVSDPIGMPLDFYGSCLAEIKNQTERIAKII